MDPQTLEQHQNEAPKRWCGKLADIPSLGFVTKRKVNRGWRETVTQHATEPWLAARLALQARIAALDVV